MGPERLADPRIQLHYALQTVTAVGKGFAAPEPDFGHASFEWQTWPVVPAADGPGVLAGREVDADSRPFRAFLRLDRPAIGLVALEPPDGRRSLSGSETIVGELPLDGQTLDGAFAWLQGQAGQLGLDPTRMALKLPGSMPDHEISRGGWFAFPDLEACEELAAWYEDGQALVAEITGGQPRSTAARCWPHHFDLAALVRLTDRSDDDAPCVGIGLSPGDAVIPEPYLYVSPWPYPSTNELPEAPRGSIWRTEGWVGLYLPAHALVVDDEPASQATHARSFFAEGLELSMSLLEPASPTGSRQR